MWLKNTRIACKEFLKHHSHRVIIWCLSLLVRFFLFVCLVSISRTLQVSPIAKLKMWLLINLLPISRRRLTVNTSFAGISKWSGKSLVHTFVHRCEQMHTRAHETHLNFKAVFVWNPFVRFQVLFSLRALSEQDAPFVSTILQPVGTYHWLNPLLWLQYLTAPGQHFMLNSILLKLEWGDKMLEPQSPL